MLAARRVTYQTAKKLQHDLTRRTFAIAARDMKHTAPLYRPSTVRTRQMAQLGTLALSLVIAQSYLGEADNFFEHKFKTTKKPEDLADFYGTEDFMEIFSVFPFMVRLMMRNAEFDDDGTIHSWGLLGPGELEVTVDFDEIAVDTTGDGELDTMTWFNKRETFCDHVPAFLGGHQLWRMTQNFGFHFKDDGTCEVYHHGEHFSGIFPVRLLFEIHSRYVIWATQKYIESEAFGAEEREEDLEEQRQNIPLHVFKHFVEQLTFQLERAKESDTSSAKDKKDMEVTLQRLQTLSRTDDQSKTLSRMRTLTSRKTNAKRAHLIIEDQETKEIIKTAMEQIGSTTGKRHEPVAELGNLARHATAGSKLRRHHT